MTGQLTPETTVTGTTKVRRHPILGAFAGLLLGLGVAIMLFIYGVVPVTLFWLVGLLVGGLALGIVLAYVAPPRHRSG